VAAGAEAVGRARHRGGGSPRTALRSLTRNSLGIMGTSAVNAVLGYGYWTLAARRMPAAEVGLGAAATSALVIISLGVHMGAGGGLIARIPHRATREQWLTTVTATVAATMLATLVLAAAAVVPLGLAVPALHGLTRDPVFALWFVLGAVGWTGSGILDYLFIAERRSDLMLLRNTVTAVAKLGGLAVLGAVCARAGADALVATWALGGLLGTAAGLAECHVALHRLGRVRLRELPGELGRLLRPSAGHHAISVFGLLPTYLLPVVVTARLGPAENAYFYTTWMIGSSIFMISPAVSQALFAEGSHDGGGLRRLALRSMSITLLAIVVPSAILCAIGRRVLELFGPGYTAGYALLVVLVLSAFPDTVSNVAVATLRVRNLLPRAALLNLAIATITLAGAWICAPRWGILGAGEAWLGAQIFGALAVLARRRALLPRPEAARPEAPDPSGGPAATTLAAVPETVAEH
jgi:O-antigen/teichoic acid export membrane protein